MEVLQFLTKRLMFLKILPFGRDRKLNRDTTETQGSEVFAQSKKQVAHTTTDFSGRAKAITTAVPSMTQGTRKEIEEKGDWNLRT